MHQLSNSNNQLQLDTIGIKPGEKLYEELMSDEEIKRAVELDNYFSIIPATENKDHISNAIMIKKRNSRQPL